MKSQESYTNRLLKMTIKVIFIICKMIIKLISMVFRFCYRYFQQQTQKLIPILQRFEERIYKRACRIFEINL